MRTSLFIIASPLLVATAAPSQVNVANLKWGPAPPSLPRGAQVSVLSGDPNKAGVFVLRLRMPPGYRVPAHSHPTDEYLTVISGQASFGMGDKLDPAKGSSLRAGGFMKMGANMNHYAWSPTGAVVQIAGEGPFVIKYVNAADDPRTRK
jgi:quercetin dioxygenase-like cupin family protein